jgi:LacI family transcriptional regulator
MTSTKKAAPAQQALYLQLVEGIKEYISRHALSPGDRIPSVMELCTLFGVSHATVRTALKVLTDEGVLESRRRQGVFVASPIEKKLSAKSEKIIAVVLPNCDRPYEAGIVRGVTDQSHEADFRVIIANTNDDAEKEATHLRELARQVAGLIIFPSFEGNSYRAYAELLERGIPWVFIDRMVSGLSAPLVATDNEHGGYLATRHLLEQGCKHVYAVNARTVSSTQERLEGHRRALKEWGIANPQQFVRHSSDHNHTVGYIFTKELLQEKAACERIGIFALDEYIARTCYTALREAGQRIPEDVAVVGYDDIAAKFFEPPLSAVRQEPYQMGVSAAQALLGLLQNKKSAAREVRLKPELRVRNSSDTSSHFSWGDAPAEEQKRKIFLPAASTLRPLAPSSI